MTISIKQPAFLSRFACLGDACEDTCCKGWGMQVDPDTVSRYEKHAPELLDAVTGSGDGCLMKRDALTDYCVKFEGGLCSVHKKYGTDFLGDACNFYPRMTRALGTMPVMTGALSCPEITRLALYAENTFDWQDSTAARLPYSMTDYLPEGLDETQALALHDVFIRAALTDNFSPARNLMNIYCVAESLQALPVLSWPEAAPFFLEQAAGRLPVPEKSESDMFFILQALCGLMAAAKKGQHTLLMENVRIMEAALHVTIQWDNLAIAHLPDSKHAASALEEQWNSTWATLYAPILRRYLAAQMSLALFPFAGLGNTLIERISIIAVRFATIQLALMSACKTLPALPGEPECTRIIHTLSRFLDHLAGAEFSLTIYKEAGWLSRTRIRALVGDEN